MSINLDTPMEMREINWPINNIAELLPSPKSTLGNVYQENSNGFSVYIAETPISDFNEYINACSEKGFNIDYQKDTEHYYAKNNNGDRLSISYEGFNIMLIKLDLDKESQTTSNTESDASESNSQEPIKSIKFKDTSDINFSSESQEEIRDFNIDPSNSSYEINEALEYVSENSEVATIEFEQSYLLNKCKIKPVGIGETYVYIQTKDQSVQSEKIKVTVTEEKSEKIETSSSDSPVDDSRTVYATPYGKKYHYSESCAGKNATTMTENSAKQNHDPCEKCTE